LNLGKTYSAVTADDHAIIRAALARSLKDARTADGITIEVVAEAADGIEAIVAIRKHRPDLLILDVSMPYAGGTEVLLEARRWSPATKVVVFTAVEASRKIAELVDVGADGVFCKSDDAEELIRAIPAILDGARVISQRFTGLLEESVALEPLTDRERQILNLVVSGQTNKEIAGTLGISVKTVDRHRTSVMRKTGSHSAVDLITYALREGLVDYNPPL